ncbi:hypothetical protein BFG04_06355 [Campylobacter pinnipediorum subsp. pinnipediorum]|uniref:Peptidase S8/S53 domain-containing protein n=1 Tax=Campylobacter pinnipediorum subsp. pinnipediorum TaxID=1660067 RepID=A0AAX0L8Y9_9BACT|nr:S8 family serine peptidase [Campylobacter pinnipediorum]OPA74825.1 hypothetical protein BFG04_06355 [Campylobacter pinnipediorum subsp. pinnipediorum]
MKTTKTTLLATSVVTILLAGCGGGGGGSSSSNNSSYTPPKIDNSQPRNNQPSLRVEQPSTQPVKQPPVSTIPVNTSPAPMSVTVTNGFTKAMFDLNVNKNIKESNLRYSNKSEKNVNPIPLMVDRQLEQITEIASIANSLVESGARHQMAPNKLRLVQTSNSNFRSFLFYTGKTDTSENWNSKAKIDQRFEHNSFSRMKNGENVILDEHSLIKNIDEVHKLSKLVDNEIGKVLVIDDFIRRDPLDYTKKLEEEKRLEKSTTFEEKKRDSLERTVVPDKNNILRTTHLEEMIGRMTGYQDDYRAVDDRMPGLMIDNGKIHALENNSDLIQTLNTDKMDNALKNGYSIVNASWVYQLDKGDKKNDESWSDFFERKHPNDPRIDGTTIAISNKILPKFQEYAENKDMLFINTTGNDKNEKVSHIPYYALANKDKFSNFLNGFIAVSAIDPKTGKIADYANHCSDLKEFCLVANGQYEYRNQAIKDKYIVVAGTSYAAPYVASVAALTKSVFPFMTNYNLQQTLLSTSKDLGNDDVYGWGLIQPQDAIEGPKKFWDKDFVVDFNHNKDLITGNNRVFNFSNDIEGNKGLIIKGDRQKPNILSLSGKNTYTGKTTVKENGILNIDGLNISDTIVEANGHLYGSGILGNVNNNGGLYNFSYDTVTNSNSPLLGKGMLIKGNYRQGANASLYVNLGQPLLVEGFADLDGKLVVHDVKTGYVSKHGKVFEDVLASKKGITGQFKNTSLPTFLENPETYYNSLNNKDGSNIYTVSVFANYKGFDVSTTPIRTSAITNLVTLNNAVETKIEKAVDKAKEKEPNLDKVETAVVANNEVLKLEQTNTSVMQLLAEAQSDSTKAIKVAKKLDGSEYLTSIKRSNKIDDINSFNTLNNKQDGFGYEFIKNEKDNINIVSYGSKKQSHEFSAKINYTTDNDFKQNGMNLNYYNSDFKVGFGLGYSSTNEKIYGDNTTNGNKLKQNTYQVALYAKDSISFGSSNISGLFGVELLRKTIKDINGDLYDLIKQNLNNTNLLLGLNYQLTNPFDIRDISFNLGYLYKKQLNKNKALVGRALDSAKLTFNDREKRRDTHILSTGISKQFGKFNLGVDYNLYKARDKKAENGFRVSVSYAF